MKFNPLISILIVCFIATSPNYVAAEDCKKPHGFSINEAGDQVWFAPGNLQYQASTNTWRFAERQFDRCGDGKRGNTTVYYTDSDGNTKLCNNNDASETYDGWIDIFGWGTSGYKGSNPWMTHGRDAYYGPTTGGFNVNSGDNRNYDWGYYNDIYEGTKKHLKGTWRTPTDAEWSYLLHTRQVNGKAGYSVVNLKYDPSETAMFGYIFYPDDFSFTQAGIPPIASGDSYNTTISLSTWEALEREGCVFLPATCHRENGVYPFTEVNHIWHTPWSSLTPSWFPSDGLPVRLVRDRIVTQNDVIACSETYRWNLGYKTISISTPGDYYDTLRGVGGCDSIISYLLLNSLSIERDTFVQILAGETFTWEVTNKSYSEEGEYYDTLRNNCGWDSVCAHLYVKILNPCAFDLHPFTINDNGDKVLISPGNLQYCPAQNKWRFAERQFDCCGDGTEDNSTVYYTDTNGERKLCNNNDASATYEGWMDLFSWAATGVNGAFPPYVNRASRFWSDWGQNVIGDDPANTWRTLTEEEWIGLGVHSEVIVLKYGDKSTDKMEGVILYPDDFTLDDAAREILESGQIDISFWNSLESAGCVFLPNGYINEIYDEYEAPEHFVSTGAYWSSQKTSDNSAWFYSIPWGGMHLADTPYGLYVRLVKKFVEGTSSSETKVGSELIDTLRCGNTYIWDLGYKLREITQTETEKEYTDELEADCGKIVSKLKLVLKPLTPTVNEITETICAGDKYTWDLGYERREVERENDYFDTLRTVQGCDSIISILHLKVTRPVDNDQTAVIHCGEVYEWDYGYGKTSKWDYGNGDEDLAKPGIYQRIKKDKNGCATIIATLHLMLSADDIEFTEKEDVIYEGEKYTWKLSDNREREFDTEGDYYDTIREGSCDKLIAHLKLVLTDKPEADPCEEVVHPFSINADGGKVLLAPGNLQYQATTKTWRFAERQFDRIGDGTDATTVYWNGVKCNNELVSETYEGWIDMFCWGTSGHGQKVEDAYPEFFEPYDWAGSHLDAYGPSIHPEDWGPGALSPNIDTNSGTNRHFDWGYDNEIWEGSTKHKPNTWRTLTADEWKHLVFDRTVDGKNNAFTYVTLQFGASSNDTVSGAVLYPDDFSFSKVGITSLSFIDYEEDRYIPYDRTPIPLDAATWSKLEQAGCIFLPCCSERHGGDTKATYGAYLGCDAFYWTSTSSLLYSMKAYQVNFCFDKGECNMEAQNRFYGYPVRLARDVDGNASGTYRKQVKDTYDTLRCGNDYTWVLEDGRTIPINQTEREKEHFDTVIVGCDSIISHLKLVIEHTPPTTEYDTIKTCHFPYTWTYDKEKNLTRDLDAAGDYSEPLKDIQGCDSVIAKLHLKLATATTEYDTIKTCKLPYTWTYDKEKNLTRDLDAAGNHSETLKDIQGCDSLIAKLHLIISDNPTPYYDTVVLCSSGPYTWVYDKKHGKSRELTVTNDYEEPLKDIQGCDSAIMYLHLILSDIKVDERKSSATIERGDSYEWEITDDKTLYITTQGTHRDTVRSMYGCDSIISILTLTVTSTEPYEEPVYDTICNKNDYEWIREGTKLKDITQTTEKGTYRDTIHRINGKDSIYCILYLTRLETKTKPTNVSVCLGQRYDWYTTDRLAPHLSILVEGDYSNQQTIPFKNYSGCDSVIYTLNITAKNCHDCVPLKKLKPIPPKDVCADSISFNYMFRYVAGHPSTYSVKFDAKAIADGFVNIEGQFEPENIFDTLAILPVNIPQKEPFIRPWSYKVHLNIIDTCGKEYKFTDSLHVFYPSKIIDQHWNDVLALFNSRYNGGYEFSTYQWYIDNSPIYGANRDHYYFPANLSETSKYRALLTRSDDGYTTFTCPVKVVSVEDKNLLNEPYIYVHPTMVTPENPVIQIQSNLDGSYWVYDMPGKLIRFGDFAAYSDKHGATRVILPSVQSAYLVYLVPKNKKHIKQKSYIVIVR